MITLSSQQAEQLRANLLAAAALLEEKEVKPKRKRKSSTDRYDEMYATGKWTKPDQLKKRKSK
jgi:hypothetical protein